MREPSPHGTSLGSVQLLTLAKIGIREPEQARLGNERTRLTRAARFTLLKKLFYELSEDLIVQFSIFFG